MRLREALAHWNKVKAAAGRDGLSFIESMRLLSGAALGESPAAPPPETVAWSDVVAGLWHKFVCRGTVEEKIDALIEEKQSMAREVLETGGEALLTEMSDAELLRIVALDLRTAVDAA